MRVHIKRNGKTLTQTQVGKIIRKELRLSKVQYQKYYDITRNKLRNYERTTGAKKQSVLQFLYNKAQFKARLRSENRALRLKGEQPLRYRASNKTRYIESFSSRSSGKITYGKLEQQRINIKTEKYINRVYGGLIKGSDYAKKINEEIKDPKQRLQALTDFANRRTELVQTRKGEVKVGAPFSMGGDNTDTPTGRYDKQAYDDIIEKYGGSSL